MKPAIQKKIENERVTLRPVLPDDATLEYAGWLNDLEVNKYLEVRFVKHSPESTRKYILEMAQDPEEIFFAIVRKDTEKFIGTIKIGSIVWKHGVGSVALMIGDKSSWGKGFASEAIMLISDYAFNDLGLRKLIAGIYEDNIGSIKAFVKTGYKEEWREKKQYKSGEVFVDRIVFAKFKS